MPALVIKELPAEIHERLKKNAELHRRSMTQEAIEILDRGLRVVHAVPEYPPFKGAFALTDDFINKAKRHGRA